MEGTAADTGEAFFQSLVRHLASAIDAQHAFVAEFLGGVRVRTLAYWGNGRIQPNMTSKTLRGLSIAFPFDRFRGRAYLAGHAWAL